MGRRLAGLVMKPLGLILLLLCLCLAAFSLTLGSDVGGPRVLIPANSWQVLPARPPQRALPAPVEEGETAVSCEKRPFCLHPTGLISVSSVSQW